MTSGTILLAQAGEAGAPHGDAAPGQATEAQVDASGAEEAHGAFPPFDPSGFASQLFWLVITFGLLYVLMARFALPRIAGILKERDDRVAADLAEAGRLKQETDAAAAAYEQALAEARQDAHGIARAALDRTKSEVDAHRERTEADLAGRLSAAEARVSEVKGQALANIDAIARDAAGAIVEALTGAGADRAEIDRAVGAALAQRR